LVLLQLVLPLAAIKTLIRAKATGIPGTIKEEVVREEEGAEIEAEVAENEAIQAIKEKEISHVMIIRTQRSKRTI
jgi:hypothetical protein